MTFLGVCFWFQPYTMRNAVLGILGELVVQVLNKDDLDPKLKITRNQFLDNLEVLRQKPFIFYFMF